jgi:hypothetical protein
MLGARFELRLDVDGDIFPEARARRRRREGVRPEHHGHVFLMVLRD